MKYAGDRFIDYANLADAKYFLTQRLGYLASSQEQF
jgi:hypothetical protein